MKVLRNKFTALFLMMAAFILVSPEGQAAEEKSAGLFVKLSSLETGMAGHAMVFAGKALERGHPVTVFLNHKAVLIAAKGVPHPSFRGKPLNEHLDALKAQGAKIIACQMCMQGHGMKEADLADGVVRGNTALVQGYVFDPNYKIMTW